MSFDVSSSNSTYFYLSVASEDDLTSYSPSIKINFNPSSFEKWLSAVISCIKSVNSDDYEENLHECELEESNPDIDFEPFVLNYPEDHAFENNIRTSSSFDQIIVASSNETVCKLDVMLT